MNTYDSSAFDSLLDVIAPGGCAVVALAQIYVDESGTDDNSPMMCVGGTLMLKNSARKFSKSWSHHLRSENIPFFHMTDLQAVRQHYKDWNFERRDNHARHLIRLARKYGKFNFCASLNEADYNDLAKETFRVSAYTFLLAQCLAAVSHWREESGFPGRLAFIFEAGHESSTEASDFLTRLVSNFPENYPYVSHSFIGKRDAPPLQVADMIAWLHRNASLRMLKGKPVRPDWVELVLPHRLEKHATLASWYYDRAWLEALAAAGSGDTERADSLRPTLPHPFLLPPR